MNALTRACTAALQTATVSMKLANTPATATRVLKRAKTNASVCNASELIIGTHFVDCIKASKNVLFFV